MILFNSDYLEGAHPRIMQRLLDTNMEQTEGYEQDDYCHLAAKKIREACELESADVHFLSGGTQTNLTVISAALKSYQGVIAAESGHINVHETGAIEATGHKVIALPQKDGKITAEAIAEYARNYRDDPSFEHIVMPKMVYLSFPTELGTLYSKEELTEIKKVCDTYSMYLYIDGARLAYGLNAHGNDVTLKLIAELSDVFYIGGTKVGALFGEAVVITNDELKHDFRHVMKQKGGLLAKGRMLGIQFLTMFEEDNLYMEMGKHAIKMAERLKNGFIKANIPFLQEPETNQIFVVLPVKLLERLSKKFGFEFWEKVDEQHAAVRFCTSWATKAESIDKLFECI